MVAGSAIQGIGNALTGKNSQSKEQGREFDVQNGVQLARMYQTAGLRDKLLAILGGLATQGPSQFSPRDLFNSGGAPAASGGRPAAALGLPANYQPSEGLGNYQELLRQAMHTIGYHQFDPGHAAVPQDPSAPYQAPMAPQAPQMPPAAPQRPSVAGAGYGGRFLPPGLGGPARGSR